MNARSAETTPVSSQALLDYTSNEREGERDVCMFCRVYSKSAGQQLLVSVLIAVLCLGGVCMCVCLSNDGEFDLEGCS
jgi:hypothetical protein